MDTAFPREMVHFQLEEEGSVRGPRGQQQREQKGQRLYNKAEVPGYRGQIKDLVESPETDREGKGGRHRNGHKHRYE